MTFMELLRAAYDAGREHGGIETRQDAADWSFESWWESR